MNATAKTGEAPAVEGLRISEIKGSALKVELCSWPDTRMRNANFHFWLKLGKLTGRVVPSGGQGFSIVGEESAWLTLADCDPPVLEAVVARHRKIYPYWRLEGDGGGTILEQIDDHFLLAQCRKREGL